ncbi:acyl-CoA dehydrogenase family protein [Noviherbaspirillum sedimenti]|uniref:Acyl-CoA dehydrogenase n=1 Tax=Noviherbaspirillum sedimenti TaxID=2320865 RepID=A0A3A3G8H1_9BURK|nr:acyl-CoA dehydrogenase family protein [Noviherbaspirillum sedimenti]RJG04271.1 acyl-CoA dehydrogenase [Noviherbaspirillum sedimenti]
MFESSARARALAEKVSRFILEEVIPYEKDPRNHGHGPTEDLVRELRAKAQAAGLIAPQLSEEWGGHGLSHRETATVFRAAGYSPLGPVAMNVMAPDEGNMHLLERVATAEQKQRFLRPLAAGTVRSAFLMTEPEGGAGSDPSMLKTVATRHGDDWVISGRKWLITGAQGAGIGIIMARTGENATMFLVDMDTPGIRIERILDTIDNSMPGGHAVMNLDEVRVPASQILGEVDQGFKYAQVRLAPARLTHCMRWWGTAKRAHDIAARYACTRHAFGKPLVDHEGVGFMLADNEIDLKQAELMIDWCASVLDQGSLGTAESSMAKVAVSEALFRVADRCVQVLGGMGVTRDTVVEQAFREIRAFRIYDGPSEVHRWSLAKGVKHRYKDSTAGTAKQA